MRTASLRKIESVAMILVFVALIGAPFADQLWGLDSTPAPKENRFLAPRPELTLASESLARFPRRFGAYYDDHFGFRSQLIRWHAIVKLLWLHVSPGSDIIVGKHGWLFKTGMIFGGGRGAIDDYRGVNPMTPAELASAGRILSERAQWLDDRGIRYLYIVAPNKHSVYWEQLPNPARRPDAQTRLDQLVAHLETRTNVEVIDLRPALIEAKANERLYDTTGAHWNRRGAFVADGVIARHLSQWFPAVKPLDADRFVRTERLRNGLGLAEMIGLPDRLQENSLDLRPLGGYRARLSERAPYPSKFKVRREPFATERDSSELPRAVIFHDSFVLGLKRFLSEHFSRAAFYWHYDFSAHVVRHERPDVVLQLSAERSLLVPLIPENVGLGKQRRRRR